MKAPDRVRIPLLWDAGTKFWIVVVVLAVTGAGIHVWSTQPEHRLGVLIGTPVIAILTYGYITRTWLDPGTGTVVVRQVFVHRTRHLLRPGSTIRLRAIGDTLVLHVFSPSGDRFGTYVCLLRGNEHALASQPPDLLRTIARTLHQHCPTVAPDTVTLLTAQADHLDAGRPVLESPLAPHLLHAATDRPRPRRPR